MDNKNIAALLGELIETDAEEQADLEKLLDRYGVIGFFQRLNPEMPFSIESLEKLQALRLLMDNPSQKDVITELWEGNGYDSASHQ